MTSTRVLLGLALLFYISCTHAQSPPELVLQVRHRAEFYGSVECVAFSPDGKWLASATGSMISAGELIIWNRAGEVWSHEEGLPAVSTLAWSRDGKFLAVGCWGEARIFEMAHARFVARTFVGDAKEDTSDSIAHLAWLDESRLAISLERGELIVWDRSSAQKFLMARDSNRGFAGLAPSPDGRILAAIASEGWRPQVSLFDIDHSSQPRLLRHLRLEYSDPNLSDREQLDPKLLAWSPDGKLLAAYTDDYRFAVWNVETGALVNSNLKDTGDYHPTKLFSVNNAGKIVLRLTAWNDEITRYENGAAQRIELDTHAYHDRDMPRGESSASDPIFSPDGNLLIRTKNDGEMYWHDAQNGKLIRAYEGMSQWANAVSWSPDGRYFAIGYGRRDDEDVTGDVVVFDAKSGALLRGLKAHAGMGSGETGVNALAFSSDGRYLISTANTENDTTGFGLRVWETSTWKLARVVKNTGRNTEIQFSRDGQVLMCGCDGGDVAVWRSWQKLLKGQDKPDFWVSAPAPQNIRDPSIGAFALSPDNTLLIVGADGYPGRLSAWDTRTGKLRANLKTGLQTSYDTADGIAFSHDGKTFWTCHEIGAILEWDASTLRMRRVLSKEFRGGGRGRISPDEKFLIADGGDSLDAYSLPDGKRLKIFIGAKSSFNDVAISPDGTLVAGADETGATRIWNVATGKLALSFFRLRAVRDKSGNLSTRVVALTPNGFYRADVESEKLLRWRSGDRLLTAAELFRETGSTRFNGEAVARALSAR